MNDYKLHTEADAIAALRGMPVAADGRTVNRTHRVIRQRALAMKASRTRRLSLWIPLAVTSVILLLTMHAAWSMVSQSYSLSEIGDSIEDYFTDNGQMLMIAFWFLPVTATLLFITWYRKQNGSDNGNIRHN